MRRVSKRWLAALGLPFVLAIASCEPTDDDDASDDDSATTDDDAGDDDTADDDNMDDYGTRTDDGSAAYHPLFLRGLRPA